MRPHCKNVDILGLGIRLGNRASVRIPVSIRVEVSSSSSSSSVITGVGKASVPTS